MTTRSFQDYYPDNYAVCYGCGRLNEHGLQIKSYWDGDIAVCRFLPKPYHTAVPGYTYGGLLASLVDCHATGAASAAMYRHEKRPLGSEPVFRFVTGSLNVRYEAPTPIDVEIALRAIVMEIKGKKVSVHVDVISSGKKTVTAEVVVFQMPEHLFRVKE